MDWVVDFQFVYGPQICAWGQKMGSCKIPIHLHRQEMSGRLPQLTALFPGPLRQPNLRRTFGKAIILQLTCSSLLQIPHFGRSGTEDANTFRGHVFPMRDGTDVCCSHVLPWRQRCYTRPIRRLKRDGAVIAERGEYGLCWERAILWAIPVTLNIVYLENQFKNCIYFPRLRSIITIHVGL
jgi:hypothetical protein